MSLRSNIRNRFYEGFLQPDFFDTEDAFRPATELLQNENRCTIAIRMFLDIFNMLRVCGRKAVVHRNVTLDHVKYTCKDDIHQFGLFDYDIALHAQPDTRDFYEEENDVFYQKYDITYAAEGYIISMDDRYIVATDAFTDLWSLGVCFWEILTGKRFRALVSRYILGDKKDCIDAKVMSAVYQFSDIKKKMIRMVEKLGLNENTLCKNILESIFCNRAADIDAAIIAVYTSLSCGPRLSIYVSPLTIEDRANSLMSISSSCVSEYSMPDVFPAVDNKTFSLDEEQKKLKEKMKHLIFAICDKTFSRISNRYDFDSLFTELICTYEHPIAAAFALCAMILDIFEGYYFNYEDIAVLATRVHPDTKLIDVENAIGKLVDDGIFMRIIE